MHRLTISRKNLTLFESDLASFPVGFLTRDESWVHHSEIETKKQSMQWKHSFSPASKEGEGRFICWDRISFGNAQVFIDYLQAGHKLGTRSQWLWQYIFCWWVLFFFFFFTKRMKSLFWTVGYQFSWKEATR